jgi:hypothetical protein
MGITSLIGNLKNILGFGDDCEAAKAHCAADLSAKWHNR